MRDRDDIEQAMRRYGDAVWRACVLQVRASEAEDVFQETFLKYALRDEAFRSDEHAKAWLLRVAMNACKDVLKSARMRTASLDAEVAARGERIAGAAADDAGVREVLAAVDALDDPPKTPVYLAVCEGYTAVEIARMLDAPEGTVYSWISRGKERLREVLS